jgi:hypothetical protein
MKDEDHEEESLRLFFMLFTSSMLFTSFMLFMSFFRGFASADPVH